MLPLTFLVKVVLVTSSGALSPGPLSVSTIGLGTKNGWKGGFKVSIGHTIVEFPLVLAIAFGVISFIYNELFKFVLGISGGIVLIALGFLMIKGILSSSSSDDLQEPDENISGYKKYLTSPLLVGVLLSALNPYFIIWWIFIGGVLALESFVLAGFLGVLIMFVAHVWMDYVWLTFLAYMPNKGKNLLSSQGYKVFMVCIASVLVIFGIDLLTTFLLGVKLIPF